MGSGGHPATVVSGNTSRNDHGPEAHHGRVADHDLLDEPDPRPR
jgi:hypothetical protein